MLDIYFFNNNLQSQSGSSQESCSTLVPSHPLPYKSLPNDRHERVRLRFPRPQVTEHGDQSVQHPHSPNISKLLKSLLYITFFIIFTFAGMCIACSSHFWCSVTVSLVASSRSELLSTTTLNATVAPATPFTPTRFFTAFSRSEIAKNVRKCILH